MVQENILAGRNNRQMSFYRNVNSTMLSGLDRFTKDSYFPKIKRRILKKV